MAYITERVLVCDLCRTRDGVVEYSVGRTTGRPKRIGLCPTDAEPLERILAAVAPKPRTARPKSGEVATLADVEAARLTRGRGAKSSG